MTAAKPSASPTDGPLDLGPLTDYLGYNLRQAQVASFRHLGRIAGGLDLTPGQFSLLSMLERNPSISQKAVSRAFGVDTSTLSSVLEALSGRGLVERARAAHDRRSYALSLTRSGKRLLARMRAHVEAQEALMADALEPGEREQLIDMLKRITAGLASDG